MGMLAAHHARISFHRESLQTTSVEYANIGVVHLLITGHGTLIGGIKTVGILHDEFSRTHKAETRTDLITELGLNLIKINRQLPIGADFGCRHRGDHLLMGRPQ